MNNSSSESTKSRTSSPLQQSAEDISISLNFDSQTQISQQRSFKSTEMSQESTDSMARVGGIRVSLACVPCRSRHVKCGAEMPSCSRCQQDDKPCFYSKSRRGMRDRNVPRRRISIRQPGVSNTVSGGHYSLTHNSTAYPVRPSETRPSSDASASPACSTSRLSGRSSNPTRLLDLYYNFFHKAHPYILPRTYFLARLESDPDSLECLLLVMQYIGSLYAQDLPSSELKEHALNRLDQPGLPPNGFTVLALLLAAIAIHGEDEMDRARMTLDRAIYMALEIRMNSRTFANMERDSILAESWRRTYWGLYICDAMFAGTRHASSFILYTIEANVELPCEEAEYEGVGYTFLNAFNELETDNFQIIPRPHTLSKYDSRDFEDEETVFSSLTYLIDLVRISGSIIGMDFLPDKDLEFAIANADAMLMNWKLHLPREKQGVTDRNEDIDEILFAAHNLLQILFIFIHRPLSRLYLSPLEKISSCAPPPPVTREPTGDEPRLYWLHTRKCLEAAEAAINLYSLPIPMLQHTPVGICGIALSTFANISACSYVLSGSEWYRTRDRIRLGIGELKKFGEIWSVGRRKAKDIKAIARTVFSIARPGMETAGLDLQMLSDESLTGFEHLEGMDYLSLLGGVQQPQLAHSNWGQS